jgi:hypothetical protein
VASISINSRQSTEGSNSTKSIFTQYGQQYFLEQVWAAGSEKFWSNTEEKIWVESVPG